MDTSPKTLLQDYYEDPIHLVSTKVIVLVSDINNTSKKERILTIVVEANKGYIQVAFRKLCFNYQGTVCLTTPNFRVEMKDQYSLYIPSEKELQDIINNKTYELYRKALYTTLSDTLSSKSYQELIDIKNNLTKNNYI